jgi:hypothetical protein
MHEIIAQLDEMRARARLGGGENASYAAREGS